MHYFIIILMWSVCTVSIDCKDVYKLKVIRAEVTRVNKEYVDGRMWITKPTRYTNAINGEFTVYKLPRDVKIRARMYEFLGNLYRPFAINLQRDLCQFVELEYKMMFYPDLLRIGAHMPEPRCPIKPGNYSIVNLVPDVDNFPGNSPFHNFLMTIGYWHGPMEVCLVKVYGILDRDAYIREQYG